MHAGPRWRHGRSRGRRGRDGNGEGGDCKGGGEWGQGGSDYIVGRVATSLTRMRMMVAADGTKQQQTP
jgi:hypothetical protein